MMVPAAPRAVVEAAERLNVSRESWARIGDFVALLAQWQARINLVSPASMAQVWQRHVLDSVQLLPLVPAGTLAAADLGSGSGFPALPLAIATGLPFHLYESNLKKAAFLREALRVTGCGGAVHTTRLTGDDFAVPAGIGVVTARALAPLPELLRLAGPFLRRGALGLFAKGQDVDREIADAEKEWKIQYTKHASLTDSQAFILAVQEVSP